MLYKVKLLVCEWKDGLVKSDADERLPDLGREEQSFFYSSSSH
jgi:hypothetical protein